MVRLDPRFHGDATAARLILRRMRSIRLEGRAANEFYARLDGPLLRAMTSYGFLLILERVLIAARRLFRYSRGCLPGTVLACSPASVRVALGAWHASLIL